MALGVLGSAGFSPSAAMNVSPFLKVYGPDTPPAGHVAYCRRFRSDCRAANPIKTRVALDKVRRSDLENINLVVNQTVVPSSDARLYGRVEFWTLPRWSGDCEDYVILKRKMLLERGWPTSALLITVVLDENGEGHAVLVARTASGDFVLDNRNNRVLAWHATPYQFIKRQSYRDPRHWVALRPNNKKRKSVIYPSRTGG